MKAKDAVSKAVATAGISAPDVPLEWALAYALPIIRALLSEMPWYKKVFLTVKFLISGIEEYLSDKGWDV